MPRSPFCKRYDETRSLYERVSCACPDCTAQMDVLFNLFRQATAENCRVEGIFDDGSGPQSTTGSTVPDDDPSDPFNKHAKTYTWRQSTKPNRDFYREYQQSKQSKRVDALNVVDCFALEHNSSCECYNCWRSRRKQYYAKLCGQGPFDSRATFAVIKQAMENDTYKANDYSNMRIASNCTTLREQSTCECCQANLVGHETIYNWYYHNFRSWILTCQGCWAARGKELGPTRGYRYVILAGQNQPYTSDTIYERSC